MIGVQTVNDEPKTLKQLCGGYWKRELFGRARGFLDHEREAEALSDLISG